MLAARPRRPGARSPASTAGAPLCGARPWTLGLCFLGYGGKGAGGPLRGPPADQLARGRSPAPTKGSSLFAVARRAAPFGATPIRSEASGTVRQTVPRANPPHRPTGDGELLALLERFDGRLISPGAAAKLLGVRRQTVENLVKNGKLRQFRGPDARGGPLGVVNEGPKWVYIPLDDVLAYGHEHGRLGRPPLALAA